jgi:hypothetical protein
VLLRVHLFPFVRGLRRTKEDSIMRPVGLIIGHGYAKAVSGGRIARFPAVAALAQETGYESAIGHGPAAIQLNDLGEWIVGEDALMFAPQRLVSILDRTRYTNPSFIAIARQALVQVVSDPGSLSIMTGMPAAWYADQPARAALEAAVRVAAAPWCDVVVRIAPEAAGVYYAYVFETGVLNRARVQGAIGAIDAGYRDINVAYFKDGRYVAGESVAGGIVDALRQIKRLIAAAYGLELALHEVDAAMRADGVQVAGIRRPLPDGSLEALHAGLDSIIATGRSLWPNGGKTLDALVLGGGGAVLLGPAIRAVFAQTVVPYTDLRETQTSDDIRDRITRADPQLAGARGFAAAAAAATAAHVVS